jgi:hypothetical protein
MPDRLKKRLSQQDGDCLQLYMSFLYYVRNYAKVIFSPIFFDIRMIEMQNESFFSSLNTILKTTGHLDIMVVVNMLIIVIRLVCVFLVVSWRKFRRG